MLWSVSGSQPHRCGQSQAVSPNVVVSFRWSHPLLWSVSGSESHCCGQSQAVSPIIVVVSFRWSHPLLWSVSGTHPRCCGRYQAVGPTKVVIPRRPVPMRWSFQGGQLHGGGNFRPGLLRWPFLGGPCSLDEKCSFLTNLVVHNNLHTVMQFVQFFARFDLLFL